MNAVKKQFIMGILTAALGVTAFGGDLANSHQVNASQRIKVIKTAKLAGADYHVTGGYLYSTKQLTKRIHNAKNYRQTRFFSNRVVTIQRANGHRAKYQYVISRNGRIFGWIWQGDLKKLPDKQSSKTNSNQSSGGSSISSTKAEQSATDDSDATSQKTDNPISNFSLSDYRASFLKYLNQERATRGLQPYTEDSNLDALAQLRSTQIVTHFAHEDDQGNIIAEELAGQFNVDDFGAECLAQNFWDSDSTSDSVARKDVHEYIYNDADSNWGHRDILLNADLKTIGMGATLHEHTGGFMGTWTAADFGY